MYINNNNNKFYDNKPYISHDSNYSLEYRQVLTILFQLPYYYLGKVQENHYKCFLLKSAQVRCPSLIDLTGGFKKHYSTCLYFDPLRARYFYFIVTNIPSIKSTITKRLAVILSLQIIIIIKGLIIIHATNTFISSPNPTVSSLATKVQYIATNKPY